QKDGYQIDSMKLQDGKNGFNYIYIFSINTQNTMPMATAGVVLTDAQLTARLEKIQAKQKVEEEQKQTVSSFEHGKKVYETTCKRCHGDGTIKAYNKARPLKSLSLEQMELSIRDIANGSQDNGMAMLMKPYADMISGQEIKDVYNYLNTVK
ncbi:c-type cytochrome, partial [Poseidonibacter sp.]|uniref:c-type cytochrome n=1 Tax=Poseidonibacter sp. TaxID=2321188 RepID=UPI003C774A95